MNFFVEYLEAPRFEDPEFEKASAEALQRKLADVKLDLIITAAAGHRLSLIDRAAIISSGCGRWGNCKLPEVDLISIESRDLILIGGPVITQLYHNDATHLVKVVKRLLGTG